MTQFKRARGLTLVELMVTLVILALLSAIVYPMYQNQVRKARRVEAKSTLMEIALAQERRLSRTGLYADFDAEVPLDVEYSELVNRMTDRDGDGNPDYYTIDVALTGPPQGFTVTATAIGAQVGDADCATFVVDQLGQRTATGDDPDVCW